MRGNRAKYCLDCAKTIIKKNAKAYKKRVNYGFSEKRVTSQKNTMLKLRYGISLFDYTEMLKVQDNLCFLCNKPETGIDPRTQRSRQLSVDHDHATGKIRKLLCAKCNKGLGAFNDDPNLLNRCSDYIRSFK